MRIEKMEIEGVKMKFILREASPAKANALRRAILTEVPTLAIDEVIFFENTTAFFDEYIAHRLSLIPLKADINSLNLPSECECGGGGCPKCTVVLDLDEKSDVDYKVIYSSSLKSTAPDVQPVSQKIPIVTLMKGERLNLQAVARLGTGKDHAKWQPVSTVSYKYMPIITIDLEKCDSCGICIKYCPKHVLIEENGKIVARSQEECSLCKSCVRKCPKAAIEVKGDPSCFIFKLESVGAIPPKQIVERALDTLVKKLEELKKYTKGILEAVVI
uniref:DNA-directed RNA polymerase subunit Rpo3 n=1 Tax=uncultured korarchaeote TaxID=161241 RepID=A0A1L2JK04_9CREN|nr:DNA-directed RNA polymerase, alpha subunit/40 kD subunit [uncultured korarchaeote]